MQYIAPAKLPLGMLYEFIYRLIGVKRNAERYMFQEPRPPVDAVRARIRESRFSILQAEAVVNFLVPFAKKALLGPKMHFGIIFRILSPKIDFGARNALFRPKSLLGPKGLHFHKKSIGFISIRGLGTQKCIFAQKVHFGAQSRKKCKNAWMEERIIFFHFWPPGPET